MTLFYRYDYRVSNKDGQVRTFHIYAESQVEADIQINKIVERESNDIVKAEFHSRHPW